MPSCWDDTSTGVFETFRVVRGRPLDLAAHWERLQASGRTLGRPTPPADVRTQILRAARAIPSAAAGMRVELAWGGGSHWTLRIVPRAHRDARGRRRSGVAVVTTPIRPAPPAAVPAQVKSTERVPSVLAWSQVSDRSIFEVLACTPQGYVAEGTASNLFIVRGGEVITPPTWVGVLPGIVRRTVLRLARRARLVVHETPFTRHELFTAQEAWLTNSLIGLVPIRTVDGRRIGRRCPGLITRRLQRQYAAHHGGR